MTGNIEMNVSENRNDEPIEVGKLKRRKELKGATQFCIFMFVFATPMAMFQAPVFMFLCLLSVVLFIFYSHEQLLLSRNQSLKEYFFGYYYRYSLTVNFTILGFGILTMLSGFISNGSIIALLWGIPNCIYFYTKYKNLYSNASSSLND